MARTREQFEAIVDGELTDNGLSTSQSADWLGQRDMCITLGMTVEQAVELLKAEIEAYVDNKQPGTKQYLPELLKQFQYEHDLLTDDDGFLYYAEEDTDAQIITHAALNKEDNDFLEFRLAKTVAGDPTNMNSTELAAAADYIKAILHDGVKFTAISLPPDVVTYAMTIGYNPQYNKANLQAAIVVALDDFRDNFSFDDGKFYKSELIAKIKNIPGVLSVVVTINMSLKDGAITVTGLAEEQLLPAGYFVWHDDSTITMQPK